MTENKRDRFADIKACLGMRVYTAAGPSGPIVEDQAEWRACVTMADVEWLIAEVERLVAKGEQLQTVIPSTAASAPKRVFLGGTCNESTWREQLIPQLHIDYFNPVVDDWTPECQKEEIRQRQLCDFCLYTITPRMTGTYSIAEVVDDSNKRPMRTILCLLEHDDDLAFTPGQWRSLTAVAHLVAANGAQVFTNLQECASFLNKGDRRI